MSFADGGSYKGSFVNNAKEGKGVFTSRDGSSYEGDWRNDEKDGHGTFTWHDRTTFVGTWSRGEMQRGKLRAADGREQDL